MPESTLGREPYVSLETFRKDGTGVKTPVWVADLDGKLVVTTDGTSFKVKRIRNDPKIRLAPCSRGGEIRGSWVDGTARVIEDAAYAARAGQALAAKYGWQIRLLNLASKVFGRLERRVFLELTVSP